MSADHVEKARGFKGLECLVSELNISAIPLAAEAPPTAQDKSASTGSTSQSNTPKSPASPLSRNRDYGRWPQAVLIIFGVIVVGIMVINSDNDKPSSGASTPPSATGVSPTPPYTSPSASTEESVPATGSQQLRTGSELTYCVAQEARMTAVQPQLNHHSDREIQGFNELVDDYNGRCGEYRYYEKEMTQVRALIAGRQDEIANQAQLLLASWRKGSTSRKGLAPRGPANVRGKPTANNYPQYNSETSGTTESSDSEDEDSNDKPQEENP